MYDITRARLQSARAALEEIDRIAKVYFTKPDLLAALRKEYEQAVEEDKAKLDELDLEKEQLYAEEMRWARRRLLLVEKREVINAFRRGIVDRNAYEKLLADIDARILSIESGETDEPTNG